MVGEAVFLYFITALNTIPLALGIFLPPVILTLVVMWGMWRKGDYGALLPLLSSFVGHISAVTDYLTLQPEPVAADANSVKRLLSRCLRDYLQAASFRLQLSVSQYRVVVACRCCCRWCWCCWCLRLHL